MEENLKIQFTSKCCTACAFKVYNIPMLTLETNNNQSLESSTDLEEEFFCKGCRDLMAQGFLVICVDLEKTQIEKNPWRTGHQWVITEEQALRNVSKLDIESGFCFLDIKAAKKAGFPIFHL